MADHTSQHNTSSGNGFLAFIVGALVVVVAGLVYMVYSGDTGGDELTISVEGAGAAVEEATSGD
ncbi:hypothetical protein [uncultured Tateyamaria sp.]|uniref:hypothetical protein n=1 Tax=uncultured Tateyamaria sp. TaxID=455651 RepID=UPI002630EAE4|nr:hypothetical protein [uncultured Tateyamaria sp.]